jgi:hypothetical protein
VERRQENAGPASARAGRNQGSTGNASDLAAALGKMSGGSGGNMGGGAGMSAAKSSDKYAKVGRNDLCPCGSGLKYKKCGLVGAKEHLE